MRRRMSWSNLGVARIDSNLSPWLESRRGRSRVTFLVNVWLHHRPHAVEPLPAELTATLSQQWRPHPQHGTLAVALAPPPKLQVDGQHTLLEVSFGRNDKFAAL